MSDIIKIPAEAKEIIKHKRTGKVYASKVDFDNDVAELLKLLWEQPQKNNETKRSH
jgi:hypothetical protein